MREECIFIKNYTKKPKIKWWSQLDFNKNFLKKVDLLHSDEMQNDRIFMKKS